MSGSPNTSSDRSIVIVPHESSFTSAGTSGDRFPEQESLTGLTLGETRPCSVQGAPPCSGPHPGSAALEELLALSNGRSGLGMGLDPTSAGEEVLPTSICRETTGGGAPGERHGLCDVPRFRGGLEKRRTCSTVVRELLLTMLRDGLGPGLTPKKSGTEREELLKFVVCSSFERDRLLRGCLELKGLAMGLPPT